MTFPNQRYTSKGDMLLDVTLCEQTRERGDPSVVYGRVVVTDIRGAVEGVTGCVYKIDVKPISHELQLVELHLSTGHKVKLWVKPLHAQIVISRDQMEKVYKKRMRTPLLDGTYKMICGWIQENWNPEDLINEALDGIYGKEDQEEE